MKIDKKLMVSIITVCFNSEDTIERTIKSVLNQTYKNIEYLIVDGASTDRTIEIAYSYYDYFSKEGMRYKIISEHDDGLYYAMNKGIEAARGEIIGIVNSDDWYEPNAAEIAVKYYIKKKYDVLMCSMKVWKGNRYSIKLPKVHNIKTSVDFCHPGMFVTKNTYIEIGNYDTSVFYADFDFWLRQFKKNRVFIPSKKIVTNYSLGGVSNQKTIWKMIMRIKDKYFVYRKNGFSRLYLMEAIFVEMVKMVLA